MIRFIYKQTVSAFARLLAKPGRLLLIFYAALFLTPFTIGSDWTRGERLLILSYEPILFNKSLVKLLIWAFLILICLLPLLALLYKKWLVRKRAYFAACLSRYVLTIVNFVCLWYLLSYITIQTGDVAAFGYYACQAIQLLVIYEEYRTLKSLIAALRSEL